MDNSPRKNTPSDSAPNPDSHVKPSDTDKVKPTPEVPERVASQPEVDQDPAHHPEPELPNELYNETLPPDTRLI